jgi:beta-ribofuranosylaminobenzene 5'-phosphate synthase
VSLHITAFPRIHVGLLDLAGATSRLYGGLGFMLDGLTTRVCLTFSEAYALSISDTYDANTRNEIETAIDRIPLLRTPWTLRVETEAIPHVGLGTKTTLLLATLTGLSHLGGSHLPRKTLQRASHRGGASGIGINGFFLGGWLWDAGHKKDVEPPSFAPSSVRSGVSDPPPLASRTSIPDAWRIALFMPDGHRIAGTDELDFFSRSTPVPYREVMESIGIAYQDILPSVLSADLMTLRSGLAAFRRTGFKAREINEQSDSVQTCLALLAEKTVYPCGMSSLGPLVYAVHESSDTAANPVFQMIAEEANARFLGSFPGRNSPYILTRSSHDQ